jgi:hypothetical protein
LPGEHEEKERKRERERHTDFMIQNLPLGSISKSGRLAINRRVGPRKGNEKKKKERGQGVGGSASRAPKFGAHLLSDEKKKEEHINRKQRNQKDWEAPFFSDRN